MAQPWEDCIARGVHLKSCDDDGYCNSCGHQEPFAEGEDTICLVSTRHEDSNGPFPEQDSAPTECCDTCGKKVWIAGSSRRFIATMGRDKLKIYCTQCAAETFNEVDKEDEIKLGAVPGAHPLFSKMIEETVAKMSRDELLASMRLMAGDDDILDMWGKPNP